MTTISATEARKRLYQLLAALSDSHPPIEIEGRRGSAFLVSEEDWRALQETLHLLSVPGMRRSIRDGMRTPVAKCVKKFDW